MSAECQGLLVSNKSTNNYLLETVENQTRLNLLTLGKKDLQVEDYALRGLHPLGHSRSFSFKQVP